MVPPASPRPPLGGASLCAPPGGQFARRSGQSIGQETAARHISRAMSTMNFIKMHGLGNDFVVIDARRAAFPLDEARAHAIADRKTGIGCDQLIVIEAPQQAGADAFMRIHNADGGEVEACGNATRCVAALLMDETGGERVAIETAAGLLEARPASGGGGSHPLGDPRRPFSRRPP